MGWSLKYCNNCRCLYAGASSECPKCKNKLVVSEYDSDVFVHLSDEDKQRVAKRVFDADDVKEFLVDDGKEEVSKNSKVGNSIKALATVVIILSVIGSFIIMIGAGLPMGIAALIMSLLFGFLAYGIGEICTLLASIDYRLNKMSEK